MRFESGVRLGPYEILSLAGVGGMGEVYKARDSRLGRSVALKVLPAALTGDHAANERFLREARAASSCDHPNICTVYEVGETADGHLYLAMAFYEGETLRDRLSRGASSISEAVAVAGQTASGLARAHEAGLVHRDIKPANLMITTRGEVKILDFGLAKLSHDAHLTQAGTALGTVAYMSPEQAGGEAVDHRTDIWALGVVLYEMVAGRRPFAGDSARAVFFGILNRDPDPVTFADGGEYPELRRIIQRALTRDRDRRYSSAADMYAELASQTGSAAVALVPPRAPAPVVAADPEAPTIAATITDVSSIAVLPFNDLSPTSDQGWFCDGLSEEIMTALTKLSGLRVVGRTSAFKFRDSSTDAREIGSALRVKSLLTGGVRKVGDRLRVTVQLIDTTNGYQVWTERYDSTLDDVFDVQDRIARATADQLRIRLSTDHLSLVRRPSSTIEAYNLYLKGRYHLYQWTVEGARAAVECFNQAIASDPNFAQPYAGLADVFMRQAIAGIAPPRDVLPRAKTLVLKALQLDDTAADVHSSLAWIQYAFDWDFDTARRSFLRSLELATGNEVVRGRYSMFLNEQGHFEEGIAEARRALDQSPISADAHLYLVHALYVARRYRECISLANQALEFQPTYFPARWYMALAHGADGRPDAAVDAARGAMPAWHPFSEGVLGWALGLAGHTDEARAMLETMLARREKGYFSAPTIASVHIGLGQLDEAMAWYDIAYDERDPHCLAAKVFPSWDPLRSHPRFDSFLRRMHFPAAKV